MATSEQEHGEMISEIIETFGYPKHSMDNNGHHYINTTIDTSSVIRKYIPINIARSKVLPILEYNKINNYHFYEPNYKLIDIMQKNVRGFSQIIAVYDFRGSRGREESFFQLPMYKIVITIKFMDDRTAEVFGKYYRNIDWKI